MCVIVYKPKGVAMPPLETLRACWEHNPDGAGLMFQRAGASAGRRGAWSGRRSSGRCAR